MTRSGGKPEGPWRQAIPTQEERIAHIRETERLAERDRRWDLARTMAACAFWCLVGLFGIGCSLYVSDRGTGLIFFYGGQAVGYAGILASLHGSYVRARERGDI